MNDNFDLVHAWRLEQALALDVPYRQAVEIADSDCDLHQLEKLVRAGCDPTLAVRIVT